MSSIEKLWKLSICSPADSHLEKQGIESLLSCFSSSAGQRAPPRVYPTSTSLNLDVGERDSPPRRTVQPVEIDYTRIPASWSSAQHHQACFPQPASRGVPDDKNGESSSSPTTDRRGLADLRDLTEWPHGRTPRGFPDGGGEASPRSPRALVASACDRQLLQAAAARWGAAPHEIDLPRGRRPARGGAEDSGRDSDAGQRWLAFHQERVGLAAYTYRAFTWRQAPVQHGKRPPLTGGEGHRLAGPTGTSRYGHDADSGSRKPGLA